MLAHQQANKHKFRHLKLKNTPQRRLESCGTVSWTQPRGRTLLAIPVQARSEILMTSTVRKPKHAARAAPHVSNLKTLNE